MTLLLPAFLVALFLSVALLRLLRAESGSHNVPATPFAEAHPNFIAEAVFSPRDWLFIQRESSPGLNSLFLHERRDLAIHWLRDCLAGIYAVRANHLRQSRLSQDLNVLAEAKLLLLFFYLSALCRFLLIIVHFVQPSVPRTIGLYVQNLIGTVLPSSRFPVDFSGVPIREISRERLG